MANQERIILPQKYYRDYFHYLLDFVERHNTHILDEGEYTFYQEFRQLTEDAQCLYIRCLNRKGDFFRYSKIAYEEIEDKEEKPFCLKVDYSRSDIKAPRLRIVSSQFASKRNFRPNTVPEEELIRTFYLKCTKRFTVSFCSIFQLKS